jgi:hypothetical protein
MRSVGRWALSAVVVLFAAIEVQAVCPPSPPTLQTPADESTIGFGPVTLNWTNSGHATYDVWARFEGDTYTSPILTTTNTFANIPVGPGRSIFWKVVGKTPSCSDQISSEFHFHTSCPAAAPTLQSPPPGSDYEPGDSITFNWTATPGATSYDLKLTDDFGATWEVFAANINGTSYSTAAIGAGDWGWEVRANFDGQCDPLYSAPSNFQITSCTAPAPVITDPTSNTEVDLPFTLRWSDVGAISYLVLFKKSTDSGIPSLYTTTTATSAVVSGLTPGSYSFSVVGDFGSCGREPSAPIVVQIRDTSCPEGTITLGAPANGAEVSSPVRLTWSPLNRVQFYRVWARFKDSAPAMIGRTTAPELEANFPRGSVSWFVEGVREECEPIVSSERTFTVISSATCGTNAAPALISPVGTKEAPGTATPALLLRWNAVPNAIGYRVWLSEDEQPFADLVITKETQLAVEVKDGLHAWYVEALFGGCDPLPSSTQYFRTAGADANCSTTAPSLLLPLPGASVSGEVTFTWSAVPGAVKYRVFLLDEGTLLVLGQTEETELKRIIPPGQYTWGVEAVFEQCAATRSTRGSFTVARGSQCPTNGPALLLPANAAVLTNHDVTFSWASVNSAIKYAVVVRINDGSETVIGTTSSTTLTRRLPEGSIDWWVIAFFANCDPVRSDKRELTLQGASNCSNRAPILMTPDDGGAISSPLLLAWTDVPRAVSYKVWFVEKNQEPTLVATETSAAARVGLPPGRYEWFVQAIFENCPPMESARSSIVVLPPQTCGTPRRPEVSVVGQALSNTDYRVRWTPLPNVSLYEVQESTSLNFTNATVFRTEGVSQKFVHEVSGAPVQYLYRVRGISDCSDARGPYSDVVGVFVVAPGGGNSSSEIGSTSTVVQKIFVPGGSTPTPFTVRSDKPWITITPASGVLPVEGMTLTVSADPAVLRLGTNTGTIQIQYTTAGAKGVASHATTVSSIPVSVSLVTPVTPTGEGTPPPDALIFPIVGHAVGANNSLFESDIRVTNLSAKRMKYDVQFTPSGTDGTKTGTSSTIELEPNATLALDDIVASVFGTGNASVTGMLEVRPVTTTSDETDPFLASITTSALKQLQTVASSRTYNFTPNGTFGQYIPAIPFAEFVGRLDENGQASILSLQQVSQSTAYRSNFGFAEASGKPVDLQVRVYDASNSLLSTIALSLQAREHRQINGMLANNGITSLADGRVEVQVMNGDGKVTAYVSSVDNRTNDPLLVNAIPRNATASSRYVVPGMAYLNTGAAFWVSDLRVFNAGSLATPATLTFYPQGNPGAAVARELTINPGEIKVLDNVISTLFGQPNGAGGSVAITTPQATSLVATARTYNQTTNGTYGQFIPGVTPAQSAGLGDRALQVLQLEQSTRMRTNIGLAETSGGPVTVEVTAIVPDSLATPVVTINLAANEFRQISLGDFGFTDAVYNARVTVNVIGGTGRVTAYGSAIDQITQDPTYVPAQ